MVTHAEARDWAFEGTKEALGREPTLAEVQFVQAVAFLESRYGQGWKNDCVGSFNMGAVQAHMPPCGDDSCLYTDSHPNDDGTSTKYEVCFKRYTDAVSGMRDVARILYKQMKIRPDSIESVSTQLYDHHYYQGFGATRDERIAGHVKALTSALNSITTSLNEPMPPPVGTSTPGNPYIAMWGLGALIGLGAVVVWRTR